MKRQSGSVIQGSCGKPGFSRTGRLALFLNLIIFCLLPLTVGAAPASAPVLSRVVSTDEGYALVGSGFGTNKDQVQVFEGATQVPARAVVSVANDRIVVRSKPAGTIEHKVVVGRQASQVVRFTHGSAAATGPRPLAPAPAAPSLTRVERILEGYALLGTGFGTDKTKVQAFEGSTQVAGDKLVSVANDRIVVNSRPSGTVEHKVVVDGRASAVVSFNHQAAKEATVEVDRVELVECHGYAFKYSASSRRIGARMGIKNLTSQPLSSVKWIVRLSGATWSEQGAMNVAANSTNSEDVVPSYRGPEVSPGVYTIICEIDPENNLGEGSTPQQNNRKTADVKVD